MTTKSNAAIHIDCANCKSAENLKLCGKCKMTKYCSRECQLAHWSIHKEVCESFSKDIQRSEKFVNDAGKKLNQNDMMSRIPKYALNIIFDSIPESKRLTKAAIYDEKCGVLRFVTSKETMWYKYIPKSFDAIMKQELKCRRLIVVLSDELGAGMTNTYCLCATHEHEG